MTRLEEAEKLLRRFLIYVGEADEIAVTTRAFLSSAPPESPQGASATESCKCGKLARHPSGEPWGPHGTLYEGRLHLPERCIPANEWVLASPAGRSAQNGAAEQRSTDRPVPDRGRVQLPDVDRSAAPVVPSGRSAQGAAEELAREIHDAVFAQPIENASDGDERRVIARILGPALRAAEADEAERYKKAVADQLHYDMAVLVSGSPEERRLAALRGEVARLREAIEGFFTPGAGVAVPVFHEWPHGKRDDSEPDRRTWNAKLDALLSAIGVQAKTNKELDDVFSSRCANRAPEGDRCGQCQMCWRESNPHGPMPTEVKTWPKNCH